MKKMGDHNSITRKLYLSVALMLTLSLSSFAQEAAPAATPAPAAATAAPAATSGGDAAKGKDLFNTNCAACHKLDAKATGPALRGVGAKHEKAWFYKWIHNSGDLIKSGDPAAVKLFADNNQVPMTPFPQLSEADIDNIIAYTMEEKPAAAAPAAGAKVPGTEASEGGVSNDVILGALTLIMAILIVMLFLVNNVLRKVAAANGINVAPKEPTLPIWKAFVKN